MRTWSRSDLQRHVLRQQCLSAPAESVEEAVERMLGCRGAEGSTPYLSLLWRVREFQPEQFDRAVHQTRSLLRVRGPRGTYFWVTPRLAPLFLAAARTVPQAQFLQQWGLDEGEYHAIAEGVRAALGNDLLTVNDLKKSLPATMQRPLQRKGSPPRTGLSVTLEAMQLSGVVTLLKEPGFDRHRSHEYYGDARDITRPNVLGLVAELYPTVQLEGGDEIVCRQELVRAYIKSYGPVRMADMVWWTGWTKREVWVHVRSLGSRILEIQVEGLSGSFWIDHEGWDGGGVSDPSVGAHLLPGGDSFLKGYEGFDRFLTNPTHDQNVARFMPAAMIGALAYGNWGYRIGQEMTEVVVELFEPVEEVLLNPLREAANRVGRMVSGLPVQVHFRERVDRWNPRATFPQP